MTMPDITAAHLLLALGLNLLSNAMILHILLDSQRAATGPRGKRGYQGMPGPAGMMGAPGKDCQCASNNG